MLAPLVLVVVVVGAQAIEVEGAPKYFSSAILKEKQIIGVTHRCIFVSKFWCHPSLPSNYEWKLNLKLIQNLKAVSLFPKFMRKALANLSNMICNMHIFCPISRHLCIGHSASITLLLLYAELRSKVGMAKRAQENVVIKTDYEIHE